MRQPDQDYVPANVQIAGLHAYQASIDGMLRRLEAERLIERLWSRDPGLWYPAAETQARIRQRLGWLDLPVASDQSHGWLTTLRSHNITDLLYVGTSDAGVIARLWRDLADHQGALRLTVLDSIEPSAVQSTLSSIDWPRTALLLAAEAMLTPDIDALARIALNARAQATPANSTPLVVIAPPDSALLPLVQAYAEPTLLSLPPDLGARFGALSPLGLLPAELVGGQLDRLRSVALAMRSQCRRDDLAHNPGVWLGTTFAVLAQSRRDKLMLLASPELLPLARWIAAFVSGSLSKHGRGFVMDVEEPTKEPRTQNLEPNGEQRTKNREQGNKAGALWAKEQRGSNFPPSPAAAGEGGRGDEGQSNEQGNKAGALWAKEQSSTEIPPRLPQRERGKSDSEGGEGQPRPDRIIIVLRLGGAENDVLDQELAELAAAGLPVMTLELADHYAVAEQIVTWQIAVATIGVVLGLNPFDEPDTAARDAYLWRRLQAGDSRSLPPATLLEPQALAEAWQQLSPTIRSTRCIAIAAYLPESGAVRVLLAELRALLARRFGVTAVVVEPLHEQSWATQVLHAGRPCAILLLTVDVPSTVAVPGRDWTLNQLRHERIAADCLAWTQLQRRFVHLDLGADATNGLRRCLDLLVTLDS
ncbi:MAG: hypothetical protein JOZ51_15245 [Chloroflexi bacterium]|nr:hypothetical protein [Chloroflexota bacterium]